MNHVLIDLEWIVPTSSDDLPEIIEIAAAKVKDVDGMLMKGEQFHQFIRPSYRKINDKTTDLTGVKRHDLSFTQIFPKVMSRFFQWLGKEKYTLYSWGQQDQKVLEQNCIAHGIGTGWLKPYMDLQSAFTLANRAKRAIGFQRALQMSGISYEGKRHSAVTHVEHACQFFMKYFPTFTGKENQFAKARSARAGKKRNSLLAKIPYHLSRSREKGLYSKLTASQFGKLLMDFDYSCALTGKKTNLSIDHFIPLGIGHGGTYIGNVYPLDKQLNGLKADQNPFEWIASVNDPGIIANWERLIDVLAAHNGLQTGEFINYVLWCFDNPRTREEIRPNDDLLSIKLWKRKAVQIKEARYYTRRGSSLFFKVTIEKEGERENLRVKCAADEPDMPKIVIQRSSLITERDIDDIARFIKYSHSFTQVTKKLFVTI
ncbi:exonuclease domain-containing protein [Brevibacillus sp. B_LB10_24]|uniref:exonuclease domain-containing protein n=1 Tax=Brevibacillus sp. B_LB10_24 TaxID=3380645 RepID=UPI0038BD3234